MPWDKKKYPPAWDEIRYGFWNETGTNAGIVTRGTTRWGCDRTGFLSSMLRQQTE